MPYVLEGVLICYSLIKATNFAKSSDVQIEKQMMVIHLVMLVAVVMNVILCDILLEKFWAHHRNAKYWLSWIGMGLDCFIEVLIAFLILKWSDPETVYESRKLLNFIIEKREIEASNSTSDEVLSNSIDELETKLSELLEFNL